MKTKIYTFAIILYSSIATFGQTSNSIETIVKKSFTSPDEKKKPFAKGVIETVTIGGLVVNRETLEPGWKWSEHVKPLVNTESCQRYHVKYFLSGRQKVVMTDGTELEFGPGDLAIMQPGHDAWVVGDEPNVLLELSGATKPTELYMKTIVQKSFTSPDEKKKPFTKGVIETVTIGGLVVNRETLEPGWKWSEHVKPLVNTESCQKYHVKYFLSGRQKVVMSDGTELEFAPGDIAIIQPGHDAWVVGDEPNVLLELSGATKPTEP